MTRQTTAPVSAATDELAQEAESRAQRALGELGPNLILQTHRVHLTANALGALLSRPDLVPVNSIKNPTYQGVIAGSAVDIADATLRALGMLS